MPDWILTLIGWLAHAEVRAIVIALVISWNGTQLVKNAPTLVDSDEAVRRRTTRLIAFVLGFLPALLLWPGRNAEAVVYAIACGLAAPTAYTIAARVLYHFWPWLEPKMSAAPVQLMAKPDPAPPA